jgi:tRNA (cytidine32/uridine32-2'-O)-methyltransferase
MTNSNITDPLASALHNIRIVLINTQHPGNIGAAARAMKNMGLAQLYLVDPKDYPADKAVWRAGHATDVLEQARIVATLDEAIADCGFVLGTSARERSIPWMLHTAREAGISAVQEASQHPVAILFGREDRGLTNEELQRCNAHLHIPTNPVYNALNIAAAVQVICYELRLAATDYAEVPEKPQWAEWDIAPATAREVDFYLNHLEQTLVEIGFHNRDNPRQTMTRLRRLFTRIRPDQMELSILHGILTGTQHVVKREQHLKKQIALNSNTENHNTKK